jgi:hypothetical protein
VRSSQLKDARLDKRDSAANLARAFAGEIHFVKKIGVLLVACMSGFGSLAVHASCVNVQPSSILDLSHWKLTLPVDAGNGTAGAPAEISAQQLAQGYRSGYFCVGPGGGLRFWAPVDGATTDNSDYPRSELRQMLDPDDDNVNWTPADQTAALSATLAVNVVPASTRKVVIGQVHGFQTNAYIKLRYLYDPSTHLGSVAALVNQSPTASHTTDYGSVGGIALGQSFSYSMTVRDREVTIHVDGHALATFHVQYPWLHVPMYFKAGSYDQASGASSEDGGRVTFYQLGAGAHANDADLIFSDGVD